MRKVWKVGTVVIVGAVMAGAMLLSAPQKASARPWMPKNFVKVYPDLLDQVKEVKCNVCHVPKEKKKVRNNYGETLAKALGEEKVKEPEKIKKAFEKAEKKKSAIEGKTFGDLIEEGKLPASTE